MIPIPLITTMMATSNIIRHPTTSSSHNETQNKIKSIQNNEMLLLVSKKGFKMTINQNETIKMFKMYCTYDYGLQWNISDSLNNVICSEKTLSKCVEKLVSQINPIEIECMPTLIDNGRIREFSIMIKIFHE